MKKLFSFFLLIISISTFTQDKVNKISGVVSDIGYPLANVNISIKGPSEGIQTDKNGKYEIEARPRDVLVFSYLGMNPVEIVVEDVTRILNITLWPKVEALAEVVVTKRKRKTQKELKLDYKTNKNIINSSFGLMDKDATALYLRTLDGNELSPAAIDLVSAINGKFAGIEGSSWYNSDTGQAEAAIFVRRKGRLVFEVDGMFMKRVPEIDVSMIERIGVVVGTAAARRYGGDGKTAGVMIINTKRVENGITEDSGLPYDRAKLRNNVFQDSALTEAEVLKSEPQYLQEWHKANNFEEARSLYETQVKKYANSYFFVLDAFRFFSLEHKKQDFADSLVTANWRLFENDPVALKALAYIYQAEEAFTKTNKLYREIFMLRPNYAQSYMDLANNYREFGNYQKAAAIYARYDYLVNENFLKKDTMGFTKIMDREFNNLLALHGRDLLSKNNIKKSIIKENFSGTRLVFEWNDSEAEFELQFVNPEGRYFTTVHSLAVDAERIRKEKLLGYSCEEFLIDDSLPGMWQVNVKYLGNKRLTPTYLRATLYYNYGSPSQRKETKVFKLGLKNVNQELFKVNNTPSITSN